MKIYVITVRRSRKKKRDEIQETIKIDGFLSFTPHGMLMYLFVGFLKISPYV
jgi:hypothetical protein